MKFSEIPNPAEANKSIKDFINLYQTKVCLAPDKCHCTSTIISAHTLSVSAMLKPIAKDGHVYTFHVDLYTWNENGPISFKLKGINDTSVFYGFCSYHDAQLFSPIENVSFSCTSEQLFLHVFRAVSKESYLKRKQADMIREIHNLPSDTELGLEDDYLMFEAASLRGAQEVDRLKVKLDQFYIDSDWSRIETTIIPFKKRPSVICNFVYAPDFDFSGNPLQDITDCSRNIDYLIITVLPTDTGGLALLSHLDTAGSAPRNLIRSLLDRFEISTALIWLIIGQAENIAIAPDWFDSLDPAKKEMLSSHFTSNMDWFNMQYNLLQKCPNSIDNWDHLSPFKI